MQIARSKTRDQFPLSEKKVLKKTIEGTLALGIILLMIWIIVVIVMHVVGETSLRVALITAFSMIGFFAVVVALTYLYQKWYFSFYFYDLTGDFIVIRKEPITPREITIPYERIQDVYVDQDLLDRFFGLYDVHLSSATVSSGMEAHIDGVEKPAADGLRQTLLATVQQKIGKKAGAI
jgi:membrane protein YdbS with pleckstrin-like domain